jgi:hypothetical protein
MDRMKRRVWAPALLLAGAMAGCGESPFAPGGDIDVGLAGRYEWALDGWVGVRPVGQQTVVLTWDLPARWDGEVFRVYSRAAGRGSYTAIATVTSCSDGLCRFVDANLAPDRRYDYYVASFDERTGRERASDRAVTVSVPALLRPPRAAAPQPTALDGRVFLQWTPFAPADRFWKYLVFLERRDADSVFFQVGETDGPGFLDMRAENGVAYRYSVAAVDLDGHVGDRSPLSTAVVPRPDAKGELVYAHGDDAARSGFFFDAAGRTGRVVSGTSAQAHWRLEATADGWLLRPLGGAAVLDAGLTTELTCGPGSDAGCVDVRLAPVTGYQESPIPLRLEHTYVVRTGAGASARYAKVRVQILGYGAQNQRLMIFDWAFQTVPGERALSIEGAVH